jgi:hypothetical protein
MLVSGNKNMNSDGTPPEATITMLDYSQRFRISWAIIWPQFVILGSMGIVIIFLASIMNRIEPLILNFIAPTILLFFPPLFLTPWAVQRALLRSYQGFHLQVERTNNQEKPLTHTNWMAPAWLWLWRNWIAMFLLSPLVGVKILAIIPAFVVLFLVSPWVVGGMIKKKYATTLYFSIHPN